MTKYVFIAYLFCTFALAFNPLAGNTYLRSFSGDGLGRPGQIFAHRFSFHDDWTMHDNANEFYGGEPARCYYGIDGLESVDGEQYAVLIVCNGDGATYVLSEDGSILKAKFSEYVFIRSGEEIA